MDWVTSNWATIASIFTGIVTLASIVAKLTPTETDNKIVGWLLVVIDKLALNNKPTEIK